MTRLIKMFMLVLSILAATGCEIPEPRWPLPEDVPQNVVCDREAPFGSEFCERRPSQGGDLGIKITPQECGIDRPRLEISLFEYRSSQLTDNTWVAADVTPSFYGDEECDYWVTLPNAMPGIDIRMSAILVFTGVTSKTLFCEDSPASEQEAWFGEYEGPGALDIRPTDGCYLDIDTDDML